MLMAHHLWEQTPEDGVADIETFERAAAALNRETKERFERTWQDRADKPNQRKVLAALANSPDTLYDRRTQRTDGGLLLIDPLFERWLQQTQR
jgi:hypothetical protein